MSSLINCRIAQLILGAGGSKRMGTPKQLLPYGNMSLIEHAISEALKTNTTDVYVVLGAYYDPIQKIVTKFPVTVIKNKNWVYGMGSSIGVGVSYIIEKNSYDAVLISLIDQPLLGHYHFDNLIQEFYHDKSIIVATDLGNRIGVPALFSKPYFKELSQLDADHGARYLIESKRDIVTTVPSFGKGKDIDTPRQYRDFISE